VLLPELPEPELEEPEPEPVSEAPAELELPETPEEEAPELEAPVLAAVEEPAPEAEELCVEVTMVVGVEASVVESSAEEVWAGEASVTEVGAAVVVVLRELTALEPVNLIESEEPDMSDQV
jgi:segregation and condensation protein A